MPLCRSSAAALHPRCFGQHTHLRHQVIEELFTYWNLDDADETLEELEDALIVSVPRAASCEPLLLLCV